MGRIVVYSRDPETPLENLRAVAQAAGVEAVQIAWPQVARGAGRGRVGVATRLHDLAEAGLEVVGGDLPAFDALDDEAFERQTDAACLHMDLLRECGVASVSFSAGPRGAVNFGYVTAALRRLMVLGERLGVELCVRNRAETSVEQLEDLHGLFRAVGGEGLKLDLDLEQFETAVVNPYDAALSFATRVSRLRVATLAGAEKQEPRNLGHMEAHLAATLRMLAGEGFAGPVLVAAEDGAEGIGRARSILAEAKGRQ